MVNFLFFLIFTIFFNILITCISQLFFCRSLRKMLDQI